MHAGINIIDKYLEDEGRLAGPFEPRVGSPVHISVVPKKSQPGKWTLIVDLSHPDNNSVNDGIDPLHCSLVYITVENAAQMVVREAKLDIQPAYRIVPVHPADRA